MTGAAAAALLLTRAARVADVRRGVTSSAAGTGIAAVRPSNSTCRRRWRAAADPSDDAIGSYLPGAARGHAAAPRPSSCHEVVERREPSAWAWTYYPSLFPNERGGGEDLARDLRLSPVMPRTSRQPGGGSARRNSSAAVDGAASEAWNRAAAAPEPERGPGAPAHAVDVPVAASAALGLARVALAEGRTEDAHRLLTTATMVAPRFGLAHRLLDRNERDTGAAR